MSGTCVKCGTFRKSLHLDHIIPRWAGGSNEADNLQNLCANCHQDKTLKELRSDAFAKHAGPLISAKTTGKIVSTETRKLLSEAWTEERKEKFGSLISKMNTGRTPWNAGLCMSKEFRSTLSKAWEGRGKAFPVLGRSCLPGCSCGRHRTQSCKLGCVCERHRKSL